MTEKSKNNAVTELLLVLYIRNCSDFLGSFFVNTIDGNGVCKILLELCPIFIKFAK